MGQKVCLLLQVSHVGHFKTLLERVESDFTLGPVFMSALLHDDGLQFFKILFVGSLLLNRMNIHFNIFFSII